MALHAGLGVSRLVLAWGRVLMVNNQVRRERWKCSPLAGATPLQDLPPHRGTRVRLLYKRTVRIAPKEARKTTLKVPMQESQQRLP